MMRDMRLGKIQDFSGCLSINEFKKFYWKMNSNERKMTLWNCNSKEFRRNFISPTQVLRQKNMFPCCKLLNVVWLHLEDLGVLEHSEKLSVLPLWSIKYITNKQI